MSVIHMWLLESFGNSWGVCIHSPCSCSQSYYFSLFLFYTSQSSISSNPSLYSLVCLFPPLYFSIISLSSSLLDPLLSVSLCVVIFFISHLFVCVCYSLPLRVQETCYENINLKKEQKGKAELIIPRYHEMVPKQEIKKVSVHLHFCILYPHRTLNARFG